MGKHLVAAAVIKPAGSAEDDLEVGRRGRPLELPVPGMRGGCHAYLHLQDWPIEGEGELTGNLPEQIRRLRVAGQDRGCQRGDPAGMCKGNQMRDEAAANPGALPGILHKHA